MTKKVDVYLVSSTLHFFWALLLAYTHKDRESRLMFMDQYTSKPLNFYSVMCDVLAPFTSIEMFSGREMKGWKLWKHRRAQFVTIQNSLQSLRVDRVFLGNDRSVLGQFFLKEAKKKNPFCTGCYLDDGVFSYLGRAASHKKSERYIDAVLKKISYGVWYDSPSTIGASRWIDELWLMHPEQRCLLLQSKKSIQIQPNESALNLVGDLAKQVLKAENVSTQQLDALDVLITLPNPLIFSKISGYQRAIDALLLSFRQKKITVGVKYHPVTGKEDVLNVQKMGAVLFPSQVSFEMILPFLRQCLVIGDMSTTILLARFVNKNARVMMMKLGDDDYSQKMAMLCNHLNIDVATPDKIVQQVSAGEI
ncbi:hypothetical protein MNBD_GAMMA03-2131 [hydrothermal vent metagenome]|uniref:Uncharacterized protein n=1 Tax=hydrothermal vent metagenome TaxID=652676 RepID=A0A3B0X0M9_9ZZZZ